MEKLVAPIFLVGHPRSGTTLLQCMLSAHSQLTSLPETHFFSQGLYLLGLSPTAELSFQDAEDLLRLSNNLLPLDVDRALSALQDQPGLRPRDIFLQILSQHIDSTRRLIEKTPIHALFIPQISAAFPDAVFVHLIRDPRDVIRSALRMPIAVSQWVPFYIQSWNSVQAAVERFAGFHPARVHALTYEGLTSNPTRSLQSLCAFLNLEYEHRMVDSFAEEYGRNVIQGAENWKDGVRSGEIRANAGQWRTALAAGEAWMIERGCRQWMDRFGYAQESTASFPQKSSVLLRSSLTGLSERRQPLRWLRRFLAAASNSHPDHQ